MALQVRNANTPMAANDTTYNATNNATGNKDLAGDADRRHRVPPSLPPISHPPSSTRRLDGKHHAGCHQCH